MTLDIDPIKQQVRGEKLFLYENEKALKFSLVINIVKY